MYSIAAAAVLSLVAITGMAGLSAAFLGGAMLGYLAEGVIVGTIYQAFPFQMVWTPLAWHGLITGAAVFGLGRAVGRLGPKRMAAIWLFLGMFGGVWALYWPIEAVPLPNVAAQLFYLVGLGLVVPLGHLALDRIATVPKPPVAVLGLAPVLLVLFWLLGTFDLNPLRLVLLPMLALLFWIAVRLGRRELVSFGPAAARPWHHALFLIAPLVTVIVAQIGWATIGSAAVNQGVALLTCGLSLVWLTRMIWQAVRASRATTPAPS